MRAPVTNWSQYVGPTFFSFINKEAQLLWMPRKSGNVAESVKFQIKKSAMIWNYSSAERPMTRKYLKHVLLVGLEHQQDDSFPVDY